LDIIQEIYIGIICGSGLGKLADLITDKTAVYYEKVGLPKAKSE
jgi:purine nucleoside phosphorylase